MNFSKKSNKNNISKKVMLSLAVIAVIGFTSFKTDAQKENVAVTAHVTQEIAKTAITFGVRGNCGMCKKTIEKAANNVAGVTNANWNVEKKKIDVSFDHSKTNTMAIHKAIAASGYDTEKVAGNKEAYNKLPGCCQYDHAMVMNLKDEVKSKEHKGHNN